MNNDSVSNAEKLKTHFIYKCRSCGKKWVLSVNLPEIVWHAARMSNFHDELIACHQCVSETEMLIGVSDLERVMRGDLPISPFASVSSSATPE